MLWLPIAIDTLYDFQAAPLGNRVEHETFGFLAAANLS